MSGASTLNYALVSGLGLVQFGDNVVITGNRSYATWTTSGKNLDVKAASLTNTTSTGTVALQVASSFGVPTLLATSATTLTLSANVYIAGAPVASTNVTQTASVALLVDTGAAASKGLLVRAAVSQTGSLLEFLDSSGVLQLAVTANGVPLGKVNVAELLVVWPLLWV